MHLDLHGGRNVSRDCRAYVAWYAVLTTNGVCVARLPVDHPAPTTHSVVSPLSATMGLANSAHAVAASTLESWQNPAALSRKGGWEPPVSLLPATCAEVRTPPCAIARAAGHTASV